jgi:hypothetical protein
LCKEKEPKESTPRSLAAHNTRGALRSSRGRARAELAERGKTRFGLEQRLATAPGLVAVLSSLERG